jgi:phosphoribosylglycinamide formyltransferase-1
MQKIAILASGAGSNARRIIEHFQGSGTVRVDLVACNKAGAGVLDIAEEAGIDILMLERERFLNGDAYLPVFRDRDIRLIVLAGFLWKVPSPLVQAYPGRIVNIHPALLPRFGGKGMYGRHVHEAVLASSEKESGITIHYVDDQYDHGSIIFQAHVAVTPGETPDSLAQKVHALEHQHYPAVVERLLKMQMAG